MSDAATYGFETPAGEVFPRYLMYDVNNVCNAQCPFCPQSAIARADDFDPRHLEWRWFERTIEEASRYPVELVRFTGDGEPLMHPKIAEMIARAVALGLQRINLTTNGSLLSGRRLDRLMAAPPHIVDFSLDAIRPATYATYRVGLDFDVTMANVERFLTLRDPSRTKVVVSMIHHPGLDDEVEEFRRFWAGRVDAVAIRRLHSNLGSVTVVQQPVPSPRWPCVHIWQRLVVDFRGHIRFCPVDWHDKSYLGDVDAITLYDAWHGPMMAELRRRHLAGDYGGCGVCETCNDWANTPWAESWIAMAARAVGTAEGGSVG